MSHTPKPTHQRTMQYNSVVITTKPRNTVPYHQHFFPRYKCSEKSASKKIYPLLPALLCRFCLYSEKVFHFPWNPCSRHFTIKSLHSMGVYNTRWRVYNRAMPERETELTKNTVKGTMYARRRTADSDSDRRQTVHGRRWYFDSFGRPKKSKKKVEWRQYETLRRRPP